ncbi:MAG: hypothetical protein ACK53Y_12210, partial [bacterium]
VSCMSSQGRGHDAACCGSRSLVRNMSRTPSRPLWYSEVPRPPLRVTAHVRSLFRRVLVVRDAGCFY